MSLLSLRKLFVIFALIGSAFAAAEDETIQLTKNGNGGTNTPAATQVPARGPVDARWQRDPNRAGMTVKDLEDHMGAGHGTHRGSSANGSGGNGHGGGNSVRTVHSTTTQTIHYVPEGMVTKEDLAALGHELRLGIGQTKEAVRNGNRDLNQGLRSEMRSQADRVIGEVNKHTSKENGVVVHKLGGKLDEMGEGLATKKDVQGYGTANVFGICLVLAAVALGTVLIRRLL